MRKPHLLYTAWGFPPSRAGGVYRALATVNAFAEAGWDVTVITVPRELWLLSTGVDTALEAQLAEQVRVIRVDPHVANFENDLASWSWARARHPELWKAATLWRDMLRFPEPNYGRWRPILEKLAVEIHRERAVDLAIGTANPHVDFIPGWHLNRRFGVRHVMDYRDAWQLDVFSGQKLITAIPAVGRWESRLMGSATEVWFVNEAIRRWHAQEHPTHADKMRVVANGYEEYGVPLAVPVRDRGEQPLVFGYVGTITDKVPLNELIEGWGFARERGGLLQNARLVLRGYLGHFGTINPALQHALERGKTIGVSYEGPVSKTEIAEAYAGFDALVLALGTGRYVTSGKVYEYAATGLPVISVHDPDNAATEVMRESPVWTPVRALDPESIADSLVATAEVAAAQTPSSRREAQEWATQYERRRQLAPRIEALTPTG